MTTDGRNTRWDQHRTQRRAELVSHTLRAIRAHGHQVGMEEIAARAGTSKTVIYRHFGDRTGLYRAVTESVRAYIHEGLTNALVVSDKSHLPQMVMTLADAYLDLVERDPEIYRFLMTPPQGAEGQDPAGTLPQVIGEHVAAVLQQELVLSPAVARTWAHGLIGLIRASADAWMGSNPRAPRAVIVQAIGDLFKSAQANPPSNQRSDNDVDALSPRPA